MAFNRVADARIDAANPRTAMRAIPAGALSQRFAVVFVIVACMLFVLGAAELNRATLYLSPVALAVVLLYSYTKRFTRWSHLVLGFALGIAPAAAWIAVRGSLDPRILLLTAAVTFWVGGFDVLYACQDIEFDRANSLNSNKRRLTPHRSHRKLRLSRKSPDRLLKPSYESSQRGEFQRHYSYGVKLDPRFQGVPTIGRSSRSKARNAAPIA